MAQQSHKKFTDSQVKELMERYLKKEIERAYIKKSWAYVKPDSLLY